jgi:hypothetical protein
MRDQRKSSQVRSSLSHPWGSDTPLPAGRRFLHVVQLRSAAAYDLTPAPASRERAAAASGAVSQRLLGYPRLVRAEEAKLPATSSFQDE